LEKRLTGRTCPPRIWEGTVSIVAKTGSGADFTDTGLDFGMGRIR
jgi:hypothetical protein